jgi:TolA-binding protein
VYFTAILHRFDDPAAIAAAEYELAHIKIKQNKWQEAASMLDALIQKYEDDLYYRLPRSYLKLAELDKKKIPPKYFGEQTGEL